MQKARQPFPLKALLGGMLAVALLAGCIVLPKETGDGMDCQLHTRMYTLETTSLLSGDSGIQLNNNDDARALAAVALTLYGGSLVVSGSFVVVNDTAHWLEAQGTCDQSTTRRAVSALVNSTEAAGGRVLQSRDDVLAWVSQVARKK